ncbi:uncharacterized protein TNCT_111171 [Trichonephila clavata]|uniref:Uncharacterized protein n=1 Tax=Trichonephila clavata TaxID=2740835 RepID=A0A8X6GY70_TRICU|nr:uncharacterized protein TNCT_111171 [Trichonephila clavata]
MNNANVEAIVSMYHFSYLSPFNLFRTALINLQELLKLPVPRNVQYVFRKTDQRGFRDVLRDIKGRGIYSIVVDTKPDNLPHLLKAVSQPFLTYKENAVR